MLRNYKELKVWQKVSDSVWIFVEEQKIFQKEKDTV